MSCRPLGMGRAGSRHPAANQEILYEIYGYKSIYVNKF